MRTKILVLLGVVGLMIGQALIYRTASDIGYKQGWSDAQCGKGQECEAGQE